MYDIESIEHTADLKYRIRADSFADLLRGSLRAVIGSMVTVAPDVPAGDQVDGCKEIAISETNPEELFLEFIRKILQTIALDEMLPFAWRDNGSEWGDCITGTFQLRDIKANGIKFFSEVKAITYQDFEISSCGNQYQVQFVLDV